MIGLIVARSKNDVIGKGGTIPWKIPGELSQFRELTTGNVVIMGRKTYEDIGRPLPNRDTIVISGTKKFEGDSVHTVSSLAEALELANSKDVYIAGGYRLYKEAIPYADVMYITEIDTEIYDGDVFFPEFDPDDFDLSIGETVEGEISYTRTIYQRKSIGAQKRGELMTEIRYVEEQDRLFWFSLDKHLPESEFEKKVRDKQGYVLLEDGIRIGLLRYNLFWDNTPFCTLLYIDHEKQKQGYGRILMNHWEQDMKAHGFGMLLTSTQVDENAQHFYRKLGFKDCGGFTVDIPGYEQPMELIMSKAIKN